MGPGTLHSIKSRDRMIGVMKVRCELSMNHDENEVKGDPEAESGVSCEWIGAASDLADHTKTQCPLFTIKCEHCRVDKKRCLMEEHIAECPEKMVTCTLGCS